MEKDQFINWISPVEKNVYGLFPHFRMGLLRSNSRPPSLPGKNLPKKKRWFELGPSCTGGCCCNFTGGNHKLSALFSVFCIYAGFLDHCWPISNRQWAAPRRLLSWQSVAIGAITSSDWLATCPGESQGKGITRADIYASNYIWLSVFLPQNAAAID